jgi:hypothetical protein
LNGTPKPLLQKNKKLNPDYELDFVMRSQNAIKIFAHGLFLMKEYSNISMLKKGVSTYF